MKRLDIAGNRYGMVEVLEFSHVEKREKEQKTMWKCKCDCGKEFQT